MEECEFPRDNATNEEIKELLENAKTIAIVGISSNPDKASHGVAAYLKDNGYTIIPVNPNYSEVLGEKCYPDLKSIPVHIDIVDIFRQPEAIPAVVDEAIEVGAGAIWMQLGLCKNDAADKAKAAGLKVVMNKCTKVEHKNI